jgi:GNAT superfamily N-acetyltransferase
MPDLKRIPFSEVLLPKVRGFDCGSEIWQTEVSGWIKKPRGAGGALDEIANGSISVWLYATPNGELVGFGSLGEAMQRWPRSKDPEIPASVIPYMAVDRRYWGQPPGPWEERYATQILRNLIAEALTFKDKRKILKLLAYEGNAAAIKLYQRVGFAEFHKPRKDPVNGLLYKRMALDLALVLVTPPPPTPTDQSGPM